MHILIADDHTLFRDALVQYIQRAEPSFDISVAKDTYEVENLLASASTPYDLVMLDYKMPGMKGLNGLRDLVTKFPKVSIALMSGIAESDVVLEAMDIGAAGYFPKTLSGKALLGAIKEVIHGHKYIPLDENRQQPMPSYYDDPAEEGDSETLSAYSLTRREAQVLEFIMRGASNKEIARELGLQEVTVKLHVRGVCRKLGAKNRTHAAMIAQKSAAGSSG